MLIIAMLAAGYLLGCINSSIILTRLIEKKDVREFGSKNAGFTNTLRNFKLSTAVLVFAGDSFKAVVALSLALFFAPDNKIAMYSAAVGVVLGHNFPVIYGFKGGKGVLVSIVAILFCDWRIGIIVFVLSVAVMFISRYVSLGSVFGAILLPILAAAFNFGDANFLLFSVIISLLSIYMHRQNIERLLAGTENRFGRRKGDG